MEERIEVVQGDITEQKVDAIVNAANGHLAHGGGVAAAISRAGGPTIDAESRAWVDEHGPVPPGRAAITSAGTMAATYVIHVVGPVYRAGQDNEALLAQAVRTALEAADRLRARSIAIPAISAGIFGYPLNDACRVIVRTAEAWFEDGGQLDEIRLMAFDGETANHFRTALRTQGS